MDHGSFLSRLIFNWAYNRKEYYMKMGYKQDQVRLRRGGARACHTHVACSCVGQAQSGSGVRRRLHSWSLTRRRRRLPAAPQASIISDLLVFKNVKAKLGGRVRVLVSGSAPLSQQMESFMRVVVGAPFVQVEAGRMCGSGMGGGCMACPHGLPVAGAGAPLGWWRQKDNRHHQDLPATK